MKFAIKSLFALITLLAVLSAAHAAERTGRMRMLMDADWRFYRGEAPNAALVAPGTPITHWRWMADDNGSTDADRMAASDLDTSAGEWKDAATGDDVFHGRVGFAWFRTTLPDIPAPPRTLHFEGVDDNGTVYLNGKLLVHHYGWSEPFDIDLGSAWKDGGPNVLAVLVENTAGIGGITGQVLLRHGETYPAVGAAVPNFDDHTWRTVHVPHDFIVEGTFTSAADAGHGSLPVTTGWYRKTFDLPRSDQGKALWIDFDGIYRDSAVWLNGHFLGRHASGYTSFRYDISQAANFGGKNVLAVHVDPTHFEGWWYEGGGIYRHVWLNVADPIHVAPWGTYVTSQLPEPTPGGAVAPATVFLRTTVANDSTTDATATVVSTVLDDTGQTVATTSSPVKAPAGHGQDVSQQVTVPQPHLWSLETPHLYHLVTQVQRDGKTVDTVETSFGIRTIRYDADTGFYLNGKPVKIQGVCNHQDFAGVGIAVPDQLEAWRVKTLKTLGVNGWRMSHNPPTPELLDACDRLGMLVMDENRHLSDSPDNLAEVASMVQRDRNHPSIIMWSMCNEENYFQGRPEGAKIFSAMMQVAKQNDPTRPVSCAMNGGWFEPGFATVEDLLGINYGLGNSDRFHQLHPAMPIFGSETASTLTTRGEYANDRTNAWVSSYNLTDGSWQDIANRPFVAGSFDWTGFDYKGEPTPYGWPDINSNFGIMDMCGFPKDNYYYLQSWWIDKPVLHLMPHWNWPGKEGQTIRVICFSNAAKVELFLNGQSQGVKEMPRVGHLEWNVTYAPGALSAKGYDADGKVVSTESVETTGAPAALRLKADRTALTADGEDVEPVEVEVLDAKGRVVPTANNLVTFHIAGAGAVAGVGNGNPSDHDPDKARDRHAFNGLCLVDVGATEKGGKIHLSATSPGLTSADLDLQSAAPNRKSETAKTQ